MKLFIYKGFDKAFLKQLEIKPLINDSIEERKNVLQYNLTNKRKYDKALYSLEENDECYIIYEEYSFMRDTINNIVKNYGLKTILIVNNLYPNCYLIEFEIKKELEEEIEKTINYLSSSRSKECENFLNIYSSLFNIENKYYGCFKNFEYENDSNLEIKEFYPHNLKIKNVDKISDFQFFINEDLLSFMQNLIKLENKKAKTLCYKTTNTNTSKIMEESLIAYCQKEKIILQNWYDPLLELDEKEKELIDICKNIIKIPNFQGFRKIKFYKDPDLSPDIIEISQSQIIREIIKQAENAYNDENKNIFRDIFITASTGAGKSLMFQIPSIYLAKKYKKLTIIIEPVKSLMEDQVIQLKERGFSRVEAFNSDLNTSIEKENVIKRIKDGEVDLLYLSPETLLSYTLETLIGDREVGLIIIDEAHIVTAWGYGFRPDYWYLGGYINKLRNAFKRGKNKGKVHHFPICAFTATAVNGGIDDSVSETIISLLMENPIKYIGYIKRDNISFDIQIKNNNKTSLKEYEKNKATYLGNKIKDWINKKEKTIVYFPYASIAYDAFNNNNSFVNLKNDNKQIGMYVGRNIEEKNGQIFIDERKKTFEKFRNNENLIIFATKAFGMGVDVKDIKNVYHYAITGSLSDYVQEIGRAARIKSIKGKALIDYCYNDLSFMQSLYGMSQIMQYQINKVLEGIYETYKAKNMNKSFLISPSSFTYIFNGRGGDEISEERCVNKLKTCLMMCEKDLYHKYLLNVMVTRPQSIFTKAYICIFKDYEDLVKQSKYWQYLKFLEKGRYKVLQKDGSLLSDVGDIYSIDLEKIWENYYPNISFPQFKYWYFNKDKNCKDKIEIMPEISKYICIRLKVSIEAKGRCLLSELRPTIFQDFDYVSNALYSAFKKEHFTTNEAAYVLSKKYGMSKARIIANTIFDLADPKHYSIKAYPSENGEPTYSFIAGTFNDHLKASFLKSVLINKISTYNSKEFHSYIALTSEDTDYVSLKLLTIFDYINYEITGGERPEIFIHLNDPDKIRRIVENKEKYTNDYVIKAKQKHERDVKILRTFFTSDMSSKERWDYIENYFLGKDVLKEENGEIQKVNLIDAIKIEKSYQTSEIKSWKDMFSYYPNNIHTILEDLARNEIPLPEYMETILKQGMLSSNILMSWPKNNVLILDESTNEDDLLFCKQKGWIAYKIFNINYEDLKKKLI